MCYLAEWIGTVTHYTILIPAYSFFFSSITGSLKTMTLDHSGMFFFFICTTTMYLYHFYVVCAITPQQTHFFIFLISIIKCEIIISSNQLRDESTQAHVCPHAFFSFCFPFHFQVKCFMFCRNKKYIELY